MDLISVELVIVVDVLETISVVIRDVLLAFSFDLISLEL